MISQETAQRIWSTQREIETATELLEKIKALKEERDHDKKTPMLEDSFGRRQHFQFGIPSGENSHRLFEVSPALSESVIRAHIQNKKAEQVEVNEQARLELMADEKKESFSGSVTYSIDGFRNNLSDELTKIRRVLKDIILDECYEKTELVELFNELACLSNSFNCVSVKGFEGFSQMGQVEVKHLEI